MMRKNMSFRILMVSLLLLSTPLMAAKIWVCGDLEKVSPKTGTLIHTSWSSFRTDTLYQKSNFFWNDQSKTITLEGSRGEVLGFQVLVDSENETLDNVHLALSDLKGPATLEVAGNHRILRTYYVNSLYPEVLVPLDKALDWDNFSIPDNGKLGFSNRLQSIWVDLFVPYGTPPGTYKGTLTVSADQFSEPQVLNVRLKVWDIDIPENLNYDVELNEYGTMWNNFSWATDYIGYDSNYDRDAFLATVTEEQKQEYLTFERNAYRVAHNNRLSLNILPYFQNGSTSTIVPETMLPEFSGSGENLTVSDWSAYDERWGPLFDGSAFEDNYRSGVPLAHHYLPFCHALPSSFDNFVSDQTSPPYWGKNPVYEAENISFAKAFEQHANEKGWTGTIFQVFYNEKQRDDNPIIWHLDEPIDTTIGLEYGDRTWIEYTYDGVTKQVLRGSFDYDAHQFYSIMMHAGFSNTLLSAETLGNPDAQAGFPDPDAAKFVYRLDIGTQNLNPVLNGILDGYIGQWMVGSYYDLPTLWKRVDKGEMYTSYGNWTATPDINNLYYVITAWNSYRNRSVGHEIWLIDDGWNNLLSSWKNGTGRNTLLYPGSTIGLDEPCASYRIKALRHGAQDYEYLLLLKDLVAGKDMEILTSFLNSSDTSPSTEFSSKKLSPEIFYQKKREVANAILTARGILTVADGDLNGDGVFKVNDVIELILAISRGYADSTMDFSGDGELDIKDAIALLLKMRGLLNL